MREKHLNIATLLNGGVQLYFGAEKAKRHMFQMLAKGISFKEPHGKGP